MNPPIGFVPSKSIDFAPSAPIFYFCFEPNDRSRDSRPAKPRVKTNYLPSGIPLLKKNKQRLIAIAFADAGTGDGTSIGNTLSPTLI
jgi:hypothetical protein